MKKPTSSVVFAGVRREGLASAIDQATTLPSKGDLVGARYPPGDAWKPVTCPSTRQGTTSTLLTIRPGQEGRRRRVGAAQHHDTGRGGVGGARAKRRPPAAPARRRSPARPGHGWRGSVFCCCQLGLKRQPGPRTGLRPRFCRSARSARSSPRLQDRGHPQPVGCRRWRARPRQTSSSRRAWRRSGSRPRGRPGGDRRCARVFWPAILELLALDTSEVEPERGPDLSQAPGELPPRPLPARAGGGGRRRATPVRAARGGAGADRGAQPGPQRGRRDLPRALARDGRGAPDGPLRRRAAGDQGRVAAALAGAALRRRRADGAHRAGRVRPLPGAARRRRDDRRGRQHARARRGQHRRGLPLRPLPQPWDPERCPGGSSSGPGARSRPGWSPARSAPTGSARSASPPPTAA